MRWYTARANKKWRLELCDHIVITSSKRKDSGPHTARVFFICYTYFMSYEGKIKNLLENVIHCVISTINLENKPSSAVVGFGCTDELEIIFGTHTNSRKAANIRYNPESSVVVYANSETIQLEGVCRELGTKESGKYKEMYWEKVPSAKKYDSFPDQVYFLFTPKWVRYTDISKIPEEIYEFQK